MFEMLRTIWPFYKGARKYMVIYYLSVSIATIIMTISPMIIAKIIDGIVGTEITSQEKVDILILNCGVLGIIYIIASLNTFISGPNASRMIRTVEYNLRNSILTHVQKLPMSYLNNERTGSMISRITGDVWGMSNVLHRVPENVLRAVFLCVSSVLLMTRMSVELSIVVFMMVPILVAVNKFIGPKVRKYHRDSRRIFGNVSSVTENAITGVSVTKVYNYENAMVTKLKNVGKRLINTQFKSAKLRSVVAFTNGFSQRLVTLTIYAYGGYLVINDKMTIGHLVAFLSYANLFANPINILVDLYQEILRSLASFDRYKEIMGTGKEEDSDGDVILNNLDGEIVFRDVHFTYTRYERVLDELGYPVREKVKKGKRWVDEYKLIENTYYALKGVNFKISAGQNVAFVGPSGSGKSTICSLLLKFYGVDEGNITIDNVDINDLKVDDLRRNIGIISQDVYLFAGSIRDNILIGNAEATEEEMIEAAKKAQIHEFIEGLPQGYDTYVGERGNKLSGGQKQRISIARMFLKNPAILILDEATSALDNIVEKEIQKTLMKLSQGRTTISVAHRLSTIQHCDVIYVLEDGKIIEYGEHNELVSTNESYYKKLHEVVLEKI